jgi:hypothetical protein
MGLSEIASGSSLATSAVSFKEYTQFESKYSPINWMFRTIPQSQS